MAAYRAQEEIRKVSALGLRFVAGEALLAALQSAEMHHQPVVIEGWLRVKSGVLQVRSVRIVAE
jgi:hypothetical protein